jgi:general stress protein 26
MDVRPQSNAELARLARLVNAAGIAMLTTLEASGALRARPLATLQIDSEGALWFMTLISDAMIGELDAHRRVNLSYRHPSGCSYVSVSGVTQILRDPVKARELWTTALLAWLPNGMDDPEAVLLKVTIEEAQYWELSAATDRQPTVATQTIRIPPVLR